MHNSILVKRNHAAHTRTLLVATALAENLNIDPAKVGALTPKAKDKDVRLMMQREAIADLLDDIALSLGIDVNASGKAGESAEAEQTPVGGDGQPPAADGGAVPAGADQSSADGNDQLPVDGADQGSEDKASSDELPGPVIEE